MGGFINMLFPIGGGLGRAVFSLMGALLFSGYILYDTSVIMLHMGPDDYIMASVSLYLDIINLFLYLLEILRFMQGGSDPVRRRGRLASARRQADWPGVICVAAPSAHVLTLDVLRERDTSWVR